MEREWIKTLVYFWVLPGYLTLSRLSCLYHYGKVRFEISSKQPLARQ